MRKKKRFRLVQMAAMLVVLAILCTGCSIGERQIYFASKCGGHNVFKIGDLSCPDTEAKVYLANYKNLYGNLYGTDLWTEEYDTDSMEDSLKDAVLSHLTKVYALNVYANSQNITLSAAEEQSVEKAAKTYYESLNKAERKYTRASKKDIKKLYHNYALAEKVYVQLMDSVDSNVSEDEARVMDAYVFYVTDAKLAAELDKELKNGATFERIASSYNEGDSIKATFGRNTYDPAIEEVVFRLEDEEVSDMIETKDGFYFFQCIHKYNEKLSEENKATIVEQRQKQAMADVVSAIEKDNYSDLNEKCWGKISVCTSADVTTNSLFTTLDSYISY